MLRNYIKIAIRNLIKEKYYSLINIGGLALGIASSLLIVLYIFHELSFDNHHPDVERLYRVNQTNIWSPDGRVMGSTVIPLAGVLQDEIPEVEATLRVNTPGSNIVRYEGGGQIVSFYENGILAADSNFFDFFNFPLKEGNLLTALHDKYSLVISNEVAVRYFGDQSALGKTLVLGEDRVPYTVTGVTYEQPTNSHFQFDFLRSIHSNPAIENFEWSWIWTQIVTYVRLKPDSDLASVRSRLSTIADNHVAPTLARFNMDYESFVEEKGGWNFYIQPVKDIHLHSLNIGNRIGPISDIMYVYIFSIVALIVIILAIINFVNLSTARATLRAKEIGVRKVMGSLRSQLIAQFLCESIILSSIAMLVGLGLMEFMRLTIQGDFSKLAQISIWEDKTILTGLCLAPLLIGVVAGLYPAFYLTSFEPSKILRGTIAKGGGSTFRNGLVVVQFTISIALISCTAIVYRQLDYFINMDSGYDKDVLTINWAEKLGDGLEAFAEEIKQHPAVVNATISMDAIGRGTYEDLFDKETQDSKKTLSMMKADEQFVNTMGLEMVTGRFFREGSPSDVRATVINEFAMNSFGWNLDNVIGQRIVYSGDDMGPVEVIGVVKDFNFMSLRYPMAGYIILHKDAPMWGSSRVLSIKTNGINTQELLTHIEEKWESRTEDVPFQYSFLNEEYKSQYQSEQRLGDLFAIFTGFAMIIACVGLLGLVSYAVNQRRKEIGIRKVLGATVSGLVIMVNSRFMKLIAIGSIIAVPLAWWSMTVWLEQFSFKIEIPWDVFVIAALAALIMGWLAVSYQSLRSAMADPVDTLRDE